MWRRVGRFGVVVFAALVAYLLLWPIPVEPVAFVPSETVGYTGPFARNARLARLQRIPLGEHHGPEGVAVDREGRVYATTHDGVIVRVGGEPPRAEPWVDTGGRPLGLEPDGRGNILVCDAERGLLSVAPDGEITVLATEADGVPFGFTNELDVAPDGTVYFTDASSKFSPRDWGSPYEASLLDLMEHGGHGRLLRFDPATGGVSVVLGGLQFANGVALAEDGAFVLVADMGNYRILKVHLAGARAGETEPLIEGLPGFADNLSRGREGRFWVGLISPRNPLFDRISPHPFLRRVVQRLPKALRPEALHYGHLFAFNAGGEVVIDLQDPAGGYAKVTGAAETEDGLWVSSLTMSSLGWLPREAWIEAD
jgi:sugar lactone lactonase YvrE